VPIGFGIQSHERFACTGVFFTELPTPTAIADHRVSADSNSSNGAQHLRSIPRLPDGVFQQGDLLSFLAGEEERFNEPTQMPSASAIGAGH
jgi:hypothetical protein